MLDVGTFSLTVFTAYCGLLLDEDFTAIRTVLNRKRTAPTVVLFDGRCGFCKASVITLMSFDWLKRLQFESFHDEAARKKYAPDIDTKELNDKIHVVHAHGITAGFFAFRTLSWELPPLWILAPFLYAPFVPAIGVKMYAWVARHRA